MPTFVPDLGSSSVIIWIEGAIWLVELIYFHHYLERSRGVIITLAFVLNDIIIAEKAEDVNRFLHIDNMMIGDECE